MTKRKSVRKVYENVELIRIAKGVTKKYLGDKLGLSLQGYRHIANGAVSLDVERLKIIADALGEDVEVFFKSELTDEVINRINNSIHREQ